MRIEILTRNMKKKAEILTLLAREAGLKATGTEVKVDGLQVKIGENYLLFTIECHKRAQQIILKLFSILPSTYATSFFEPVTDQKIIVTAVARPLMEVIGNLTVLEHLDLESGELAGNYQVQWQSRDVAVSAVVSLVIQGSAAVAKIKFVTHFRDSEYHCRKVLESISLRDILTVFTPEVSLPVDPPIVEPVAIEKQIILKEDNWNELFDLLPATIVYLPDDEYRLEFEPDSYLAFRKRKDGIELLLHIENPCFLSCEVVYLLKSVARVEEIIIKKLIRQVTINPDILIKKLGFQKNKSFYLFTREDIFKTLYDIKRREVLMEAVLPFADGKIRERVMEIYMAMEALAKEILESAV